LTPLSYYVSRTRLFHSRLTSKRARRTAEQTSLRVEDYEQKSALCGADLSACKLDSDTAQ